MTIEEIKDFLVENKDDDAVKAFLTDLIGPAKQQTPEEIAEFLKTDEGRLIVQPLIDSAVTKAVKTRDKAHETTLESEVKKRVASEMLKLNPQEDPLQKEVRELKETLEKEKVERAKEALKRQISEEALKVGVDPFWLEDYMPESLEVGRLFVQKIANYNKEQREKVANETLAGSAYKPSGGIEKAGKVDLSKLSISDLEKMEMDGTLDSAILG